MSGTSTPRIGNVSSRRPSRSYSFPASQRSRLTTSSTRLRHADGGHAVEVLDVDHAQAAQLHVVAREVRGGADQRVAPCA